MIRAQSQLVNCLFKIPETRILEAHVPQTKGSKVAEAQVAAHATR
jgi:hypothetical protein